MDNRVFDPRNPTGATTYYTGPWRHPVKTSRADAFRRRSLFMMGAIVLGFAFAAGIHVIAAAPGKIARTQALYQQIEAMK